MAKLFPIVVRKTTVVGGGVTDAFKITILVPESSATPSEATSLTLSGYVDANAAPNEATSATLKLAVDANASPTDTPSLTIGATEANATPTDPATQSLTATYADTAAAQTEATTATVKLGADANATPSDVRDAFVRYWASASSDNDSSRTTPANANGQSDGAFATIKTNLSTGDLTNPVILTSTTFGVPSTGSPTTKKIRVWFDVGARTTTLDTIKLFYNVGGGDVAIYTHAGTAAVNHDAGDFTFDVSALTMAQLASISLKASYTASVVASPETSIRVDAWAIEIEGTV